MISMSNRVPVKQAITVPLRSAEVILIVKVKFIQTQRNRVKYSMETNKGDTLNSFNNIRLCFLNSQPYNQ